MTTEELTAEVEKLKARNKKVESDKAWEGSLARKSLIALFTYLAISLYLAAIGVENPWINAVVPAIGFLLSTLTLGFFKNLWLKYVYKH